MEARRAGERSSKPSSSRENIKILIYMELVVNSCLSTSQSYRGGPKGIVTSCVYMYVDIESAAWKKTSAMPCRGWMHCCRQSIRFVYCYSASAALAPAAVANKDGNKKRSETHSLEPVFSPAAISYAHVRLGGICRWARRFHRTCVSS